MAQECYQKARKQQWGTVCSFVNFLDELRVIEENPTKLIRATKLGKNFVHVSFSDEQFKRILDEAAWYVDDLVKMASAKFIASGWCCFSNYYAIQEWT
jgi:hypothetical protein